MCAGCGGEWGTDPAAKCYFPPWGKPQHSPVEPLQTSAPPSSALSSWPALLSDHSLGPASPCGWEEGRWKMAPLRVCLGRRQRGGREGRGECGLPFSSWSVGRGGSSGGAGPSCPQLPRGSDAQAHCSACFLGLHTLLSHRNKAQVEAGSLPGPKEQIQLTATQPQKTLHTLCHCL